jgi:antitoxin (DNA-binding transcriptional repressor) of toxin-antitoxin stability system
MHHTVYEDDDMKLNHKVPVSALRTMTAEIISQVLAGRTFEVTLHGELVAELRPIHVWDADTQASFVQTHETIAAGGPITPASPRPRKPLDVTLHPRGTAFVSGAAVGAGAAPLLDLPPYDPSTATPPRK